MEVTQACGGYSMDGAYNPVTRVQDAHSLKFPHGLGQPTQPLPQQLLTEEYCEQRVVLKVRVLCANLQHSLRAQNRI